MKNTLAVLVKIGRYILISAGLFLLLAFVIAFTRIPFDMHRWLGMKNSEFKFVPTTVVMLGGSGMPSGSNLLRLHYTAELASFYPFTKIIIAHPDDSAVIAEMKRFLYTFNVDSERVFTRSHGTNTRQQALEIKASYAGIENEKIVLVTAPENMYRSLATFRKVGFSSVGGMAAFENAMFVDLNYNHLTLGGSRFAPDVSDSLGLRYNFWNYLKLEITCIREYAAILYYKINGWI